MNKKFKNVLFLALAAFTLGFAFTAIADDEKNDDEAILALINGEPVTQEEVNALIGGYLSQIKKRVYQVRRAAIDHLIEQKLWKQAAEKAKMDKDTWMNSQVSKKGLDLQQWNEAAQDVLVKLRTTAEKDGKIQLLITESEVPKVEIDLSKAPSYGNPKAEITIVEFSDYRCKFCASLQGVLREVLGHYDGKVRLVMKDFPLDRHQGAKQAAIGSHCVREQNADKYWEFRQKLFERALLNEQQSLDMDMQKEMVRDLGLDVDAFTKCVQSNKYEQLVENSYQEGLNLYVTGIPTLYIIVGSEKSEGEEFLGNPTFENLKQLIDEALN